MLLHSPLPFQFFSTLIPLLDKLHLPPALPYPRMEIIGASPYELEAQLAYLFEWSTKINLAGTTTDPEVIPMGPINFIADAIDIPKTTAPVGNRAPVSTSENVKPDQEMDVKDCNKKMSLQPVLSTR